MNNFDANVAFKELKDTLQTRNQELSETKERLMKVEKDLDAYEEKNEVIANETLERKNADLEMKEKIADLEKQLLRMPQGKGKTDEEQKSIDIKKALNIFLRKNADQKSAEEREFEQKYLRTDNDPSGGYLTPPEYYQEILKKITEISPVRSVARILRTSRESLWIPVRETLLLGNWLGEGVDFQASTSKYGLREIKVNMLSVSSVTTIQMVQDSVFNIEDQITQDIAESFAFSEGRAFVVGDGINKPEGILTNVGTANGIQVVPSGIADSFDGDSLIDIFGQLKTGYNPAYMLNRRTIAYVRKLKDGLGRYLWAPGLAEGYPNTIDGAPYISAIDVPDIAADAYPIIFGDFYRGYTIADHIAMYIVRDNYTLSAKGQIAFNVLRRVGGMVTLPEAIKVLKCSLS